MERIIIRAPEWCESFRADAYEHIYDFMRDIGLTAKTAIKVALWAETALPGAQYPGRLPRGLHIYIDE